MKLSQPKSARVINTSRILCELRKNGCLSKADLARNLNLNKVSTGEIVEDLISLGFVREAGKVEVENGRKPTTVEIVKDARYILAIDIGSRTVTVALCNLVGEIIKIERIPTDVHTTVEQFCVGIFKSCARTLKLVDETQLMGIGITVSGKISIDGKVILSCSYLPWKNIAIADVLEQNLHVSATVVSTGEALICAEKIYNPKGLVSSKPIMYLDWGDHISMSVVTDGKVAINNSDFGHLRVANTGICVCGEIGCLETVCATWALSGDSSVRLKNLWNKCNSNVINAMAKALNTARQVVGSDRIIISGEGASIPDDKLNELQSLCEKATLERSVLGEKANITACAESALDCFLYKSTMLDEISAWV